MNHISFQGENEKKSRGRKQKECYMKIHLAEKTEHSKDDIAQLSIMQEEVADRKGEENKRCKVLSGNRMQPILPE